MARLARIVVPGVAHHVTQRGNRRQPVFFGEDDYAEYRALIAQSCRVAGVEVWGYCLMPNHVHLILVPADESGLRAALADAHRRYSRRVNFREGWRGYLWPSYRQRGALRFCRDGRSASVGVRALCRTQSGARRPRGTRRRVAVVECGSASCRVRRRLGARGADARNRTGLAGAAGPRARRCRPRCVPAQCPHGAADGFGGFCGRPREADRANACPSKTGAKAGRRDEEICIVSP